MKDPPLLVDQDGQRFKSVNPSKTQGLFNHIKTSAEDKGMIVNAKKTGLLCVSAASSFRAKAHLFDDQGGQIGSEDRLKVLGFFVDKDAGVWLQVGAICARLRSRSWAYS